MSHRAVVFPPISAWPPHPVCTWGPAFIVALALVLGATGCGPRLQRSPCTRAAPPQLARFYAPDVDHNVLMCQATWPRSSRLEAESATRTFHRTHLHLMPDQTYVLVEPSAIVHEQPRIVHGTWCRVGGRLLLSPEVVGGWKREFRIRGQRLEWDGDYVRGLRLRPSSIEEWNAAHEYESEPPMDWAEVYRVMKENTDALIERLERDLRAWKAAEAAEPE